MQKRTLHELVNTNEPVWPLVQQWVANARNNVEVLPAQPEQAVEVLLHLQITTRSPMGAIALESGGVLIDHGWLRFLGSGHERLTGNFLTWNSEGSVSGNRSMKGALIIAYDVLGGFFALNGGAFPGKPGTAFYFAPDTLQWENTNKSYTALLQWALSGDIEKYYETMRWPSWENDIAALNGDQGISIYPFVFLNKEIPVSERSRRPISIYELWDLYHDLARQLGHLPPGSPVQFIIERGPSDKSDNGC